MAGATVRVVEGGENQALLSTSGSSYVEGGFVDGSRMYSTGIAGPGAMVSTGVVSSQVLPANMYATSGLAVQPTMTYGTRTEVKDGFDWMSLIPCVCLFLVLIVGGGLFLFFETNILERPPIALPDQEVPLASVDLVTAAPIPESHISIAGQSWGNAAESASAAQAKALAAGQATKEVQKAINVEHEIEVQEQQLVAEVQQDKVYEVKTMQDHAQAHAKVAQITEQVLQAEKELAKLKAEQAAMDADQHAETAAEAATAQAKAKLAAAQEKLTALQAQQAKASQKLQELVAQQHASAAAAQAAAAAASAHASAQSAAHVVTEPAHIVTVPAATYLRGSQSGDAIYLDPATTATSYSGAYVTGSQTYAGTDYVCSAGVNNWQNGWSAAKKHWCCHHGSSFAC